MHDQLQDARIWLELEPLVSAYAAVRTVYTPPLHTIGQPAEWADHIARYAREAISPDAVDLAVTIGGAAEAGIELVSDGTARAALLVDPDLTPLADQSTIRLLGEPEASNKLAAFFESLNPHLEGFSSTGTLSAEGMDAFVEATFAGDEELPAHRRQLVRHIMREQLTAMLPLDVAGGRSGSPERPDWITRLASLADRCTIAVGPEPAWPSQPDLESAVHQRAPGVTVVRLTSAPTFILSHPPNELDAVVQDLLRR